MMRAPKMGARSFRLWYDAHVSKITSVREAVVHYVAEYQDSESV